MAKPISKSKQSKILGEEGLFSDPELESLYQRVRHLFKEKGLIGERIFD